MPIKQWLSETPPLTRGRLGAFFLFSGAPGNTPAYAGKTPLGIPTRMKERKHPRLRGEDAKSPILKISVTETPPLTRGRLGTRMRCEPEKGNTPAYAGKTIALRDKGSERRKHPRLRGEDNLGPTCA